MKLGDLEFEKVGRILSLQELGELEGGLKLIRERFKMEDDVLLDRSMLIVVLELRQRCFRGS